MTPRGSCVLAVLKTFAQRHFWGHSTNGLFKQK
uniref:Uncharacterized protein n=1 Tax=Anguilla anguilla TaxID=7936 RepID=A0A0E9R5I2_ANGAN